MIHRLSTILHRDEHGTAMTEFVITLPVFLIVFLGINALHKFHDAATRAHPAANKVLWQQAHTIANSDHWSKWADPRAMADELEDDIPQDHDTLSYNQTKALRLRDFGTFGEALNGSAFEESRDWAFLSDERDQDVECGGCVRDWVQGELFAASPWYTNLTTMDWTYSDEIRAPAIIDAEWVPVVNVVPWGAKSRLAVAAGTRYGLAFASASKTAEWNGISMTFSPQYQVVAPPRTMEDDDEARFAVGMARADYIKYEWADMPGFEWEDLFSFEFGLGPNDHIMGRH